MSPDYARQQAQLRWLRDVDTAIALYELAGSPTTISGDDRPEPDTRSIQW